MIGESIAETQRNLVHVIDRTHDRLLSIDTDTGGVVASTGLLGAPDVGALMSLSLDGTTLCVPLSSSGKLQFIRLSDLTTRDVVSTGIVPDSTAYGADGQLYVASQGGIFKVDPVSDNSVGVGSGYSSPLLKGNADGTKLFIMEMGATGGSSTIAELTVVPGGVPIHSANYGPSKENDQDFEVNDADGIIYTTAGGVYGINAISLLTDVTRFWPYDSPYGVAVAFISGGDFVYGASGSYYPPRIRRFNRLTGSISATFDIEAANNGQILTRSLQVTPNGHIFFCLVDNGVGLIGATDVIPSIPASSVPIDLGGGRTTDVEMPLTLSAAGASAKGTLTWSKRQGPGKVVFSSTAPDTATATFALPGNYLIEASYTENGLVSRDTVTVLVRQAPRAIVAQPASMHWRVPASASETVSKQGPWYTNSFDDAAWASGPTALGYETRIEGFYDPLIGTSVTSAMQNLNRTALLRIPFNFAFLPGQVQSLELRMKFEDGFVAYLNGVPVTRANAPEGDLAYNAGATGQRSAAQALAVSVFDLTAQRSLLRKGENVLAVQGLNFAVDDPSFLCSPELYATVELTPFDAWLSDFAGIPAEVSGPDDDADHDGRSNWLEFATGGNPGHIETPAELNALQVQERVTGVGDSARLEITYLRRNDSASTGLNYSLLFANDLEPGSWRLAGTSRFPITEVSEQPSAVEDMVSVRIRLELPLTPARTAVFSRVAYE